MSNHYKEEHPFDYEVFAFLLLGAFLLATLVALLTIICTRFKPNIKRLEPEKYYLDPKKGGEKVLFPSLKDAASIDLSIIIPAYNEQDRLPVMLEEAMGYLENRQEGNPSFSYEVIVVDDGSRDTTSETALKYSEQYGTEKFRVLTLAENRGKGGAIRMGMLSGRGRLLLFADADGATKFPDIEKLEAEMVKINTKDDSMAVVVGSRAHLEKDSITERTLFRTMLMFGFHFLVWFLCVRGIKDTQCGFKLFTREAATLLFYNLHVERWAFDVDLLYIAQHLKVPIGEVGVNWQEIDGSKLSPVFSSLQMGRDLILIRLRYLLGVWRIQTKPKTE